MRWKLAWILAVLLVAFARPVRAQDAAPLEDVAGRIDSYLRGLSEVGLFAGAVLVAKDGRVLLEAAYGPADVAAGVANTPATRFKLMSVTKSFTAVAVMRLVQAGKLGLEDRLGDRLPDWPAGWRAVTVHQLLEHTAGIANLEREWAAAATQGTARGLALWKELAPRFAALGQEAPAGTRPRYANFNYVLLGVLVEAVSGAPYEEFVRREVLAPAGLTQTGFDDGTRRPELALGYFRADDGGPKASAQDMSMIRGAGDVFSTVGDLWRLDRALRGDALLSEATRAAMYAPTAASPAYACGWMVTPVEGRACLHHSGGANGYVADFLRFPDDDACVAVASNLAYAPISRISADVAALLFGGERPLARKIARAALDAFAGTYRSPEGGARTLVVRRCGDALLLFDVFQERERQGAQALVPLGDGLFSMPYGDERLRFDAPAEGKAGSARLESADGVKVFARSEPPDALWRSAAGAYLAGAADDAPYRLEASGGGFVLHAPDGGPRELALVPATESLALALYAVDGGTLLRLELDEEGTPCGFRMQRNDGRNIVATKQAR